MSVLFGLRLFLQVRSRQQREGVLLHTLQIMFELIKTTVGLLIVTTPWPSPVGFPQSTRDSTPIPGYLTTYFIFQQTAQWHLCPRWSKLLLLWEQRRLLTDCQSARAAGCIPTSQHPRPNWRLHPHSCHPPPPTARRLGWGSIRLSLNPPPPPWELGRRRGLWGTGLRTSGLWSRPGWGAEARQDGERGTGTGRDGDGAGVTGTSDRTRASGVGSTDGSRGAAASHSCSRALVCLAARSWRPSRSWRLASAWSRCIAWIQPSICSKPPHCFSGWSGSRCFFSPGGRHVGLHCNRCGCRRGMIQSSTQEFCKLNWLFYLIAESIAGLSPSAPRVSVSSSLLSFTS